jgi:hypothetical protein
MPPFASLCATFLKVESWHFESAHDDCECGWIGRIDASKNSVYRFKEQSTPASRCLHSLRNSSDRLRIFEVAVGGPGILTI